MSNWIEPPPQQRGMGCFGKGCLTLVALLVLFTLAFVGGAFWTVHRARNLTSSEPLTFGNVTANDDGSASSVEEHSDIESAPMPEPAIPVESARSVHARWRAFEKAADRGQPARIELSESDINRLMQEKQDRPWTGEVAIGSDSARVRVSVALDRLPSLFRMQGRFINGEATVQASPDGDPAKARITNVVIGNEAWPETRLNQRWFGGWSINDALNQWLTDKDITRFSIENGRVIGETGGRR